MQGAFVFGDEGAVGDGAHHGTRVVGQWRGSEEGRARGVRAEDREDGEGHAPEHRDRVRPLHVLGLLGGPTSALAQTVLHLSACGQSAHTFRRTSVATMRNASAERAM